MEMTDSEILEGNKLIAEFMGIQVIDNEIDSPFRPNLNCFRENELKYHSDWNWLMPVVGKISTIKFRFGRFSTKIVTLSREPYCRMDSTAKSFRNSSYNGTPLINAVYETVLDFIKWYNKTQITS